MITRLESFTNEADQCTSSARTEAPAGSRRARVGWDITLGLCGLGYVAVVLFDDIESPLLSMALIFLVAYTLIQPHLRNR